MGHLFSLAMNTQIEAFDGVCVVFAAGDKVFKLPANGAKNAFVRELECIQQVKIPKQCGFVEAREETVNAEMLRKIPRSLRQRLWKGCVPGTPAIVMKRLPGITALKVVERGATDEIRATIVAQMARLLTEMVKCGLYHTDMKLENMQCIDKDLTIRLLDVGSIWWKPGQHATYTYAIRDFSKDPAAAMSINVVCTLIELYNGLIPSSGLFDCQHYIKLRTTTLRQIKCPAVRAQLDTLLVREEHFTK